MTGICGQMEVAANNLRANAASGDAFTSWWAICGFAFSAVGAIGVLEWLYPSGRGWDSISAYFDQWPHSVTVIALLGMGSALSSVAEIRGCRQDRVWILASWRTTLVALSAVLVIVFIVPVVIWIVRVIAMVASLLLLYNLSRIYRGHRPYWPRSPWKVIPWILRAIRMVPFGG